MSTVHRHFFSTGPAFANLALSSFRLEGLEAVLRVLICKRYQGMGGYLSSLKARVSIYSEIIFRCTSSCLLWLLVVKQADLDSAMIVVGFQEQLAPFGLDFIPHA